MPAIALDCLQTLLWLNRRHGQLIQENELIRRAHRRSGGRLVQGGVSRFSQVVGGARSGF